MPTPWTIRREGVVVEVPHEYEHGDASDYHEFVFLGARRGYPATIYRDWLGREREDGAGWSRWLVLHCNNGHCNAVAFVRLNSIEHRVNEFVRRM